MAKHMPMPWTAHWRTPPTCAVHPQHAGCFVPRAAHRSFVFVVPYGVHRLLLAPFYSLPSTRYLLLPLVPTTYFYSFLPWSMYIFLLIPTCCMFTCLSKGSTEVRQRFDRGSTDIPTHSYMLHVYMFVEGFDRGSTEVRQLSNPVGFDRGSTESVEGSTVVRQRGRQLSTVRGFCRGSVEGSVEG
jgi:hypothetical protein